MKSVAARDFSELSAGRLLKELSDMSIIRPWPGILRGLGHLALVIALTVPVFTTPSMAQAAIWAFLASVAYASLLVLTHDALHHTLTGLTWFDEIFPRIVSYPMLWQHGVYSELHKIHHKMNGTDLRDPERVQPTAEEYENAGRWGKFMMRHQGWIRCFLLGGWEMLYSHLTHALALRHYSPRLKRLVTQDLTIILAVQITIHLVAWHYGVWTRWVLYFVMAERVLGFVHQFRSQIEHYGLWGESENPLFTQIFSSRNMTAGFFIRHYFNGLNFHSVHHAFPRIPWNHLQETDVRLRARFAAAGRPWAEAEPYLRTAFSGLMNPRFVGSKLSRRGLLPQRLEASHVPTHDIGR